MHIQVRLTIVDSHAAPGTYGGVLAYTTFTNAAVMVAKGRAWWLYLDPVTLKGTVVVKTAADLQ